MNPLGVRVIAWLLLVGVCAIVVTLVAMAFPGTPLDFFATETTRTLLASKGWLFVALLLAVAALVTASALGLLRRRRWALWATSALFGANAIAGGVELARSDPLRAIVGVVAAGVLIAFLQSRRVRSAFR